MRPIPLPVLRQFLFGTASVVDLAELFVTAEDEPDQRFAFADRKITWEDNDYLAIGLRPPIGRRTSLQDAIGELQIIIPTASTEFLALAAGTDLAGSRAKIYRLVLQAPDERVLIYDGLIKSPVGIEDSTVVLSLVGRSADPDALDAIPARIYGADCQYIYGGPLCGVDLDRYSFSGTVGEGSHASIIRDAALTNDVIDGLTTLLKRDADGVEMFSAIPSEVTYLTGVNVGQSRPCDSVDPCVIVLRRPFYSPPAIGDQYRVRRVCPKTGDACEGFDNLGRHGGQPWIPKKPQNLRRSLLR